MKNKRNIVFPLPGMWWCVCVWLFPPGESPGTAPDVVVPVGGGSTRPTVFCLLLFVESIKPATFKLMSFVEWVRWLCFRVWEATTGLTEIEMGSMASSNTESRSPRNDMSVTLSGDRLRLALRLRPTACSRSLPRSRPGHNSSSESGSDRGYSGMILPLCPSKDFDTNSASPSIIETVCGAGREVPVTRTGRLPRQLY